MDLGELINKKKRDKTISVRLPKETLEAIQEIAKENNLSQSEVIEASVNGLKKFLPREKSNPKNGRYLDKDGIPYIPTHLSKKISRFSENKVISLFSGAGGLDLGLEMAGFATVGCIEIDEHCRETLRHNRPDWKIFENTKKDSRQPGDIRQISASEILKSCGLKKYEAALVVGGAPCQPFSNIGKKMGKDCPENGDLFLEFVRIVDGTRPKAFIFENVSGMTQSKHGEVVKYMKEHFTKMGYSVSAKVLNAANYSVAQKRERFFLIGIRGKTPPAFPLPTHFKAPEELQKFRSGFYQKPPIRFKPWVSIRQAFAKLPPNYQDRTDFAVMNVSAEVQERMKLIGPNENFKVLPMEMRPNCWKNGKHQGVDTFGRLDENDVSVTIRTAAYNPSKGKYIHPTENRGLNSIELAALQSFPRDWLFKARGRERITLVSAGMQIGNAVPPLLAKALGEALKIQISEL